jgi:hypothetical protein
MMLMFSISTTLSLLLIPVMESVALTATAEGSDRSSVHADANTRQLVGYQSILSYQPKTLVTDNASSNRLRDCSSLYWLFSFAVSNITIMCVFLSLLFLIIISGFLGRH